MDVGAATQLGAEQHFDRISELVVKFSTAMSDTTSEVRTDLIEAMTAARMLANTTVAASTALSQAEDILSGGFLDLGRHEALQRQQSGDQMRIRLDCRQHFRLQQHALQAVTVQGVLVAAFAPPGSGSRGGYPQPAGDLWGGTTQTTRAVLGMEGFQATVHAHIGPD